MDNKILPIGCDSTINNPKTREISNCITSRYNAGIQNKQQIGMCVIENKHLRETLEKNSNINLEETQFIDAYNRNIRKDGISGVIHTRVNASNDTYVLEIKKDNSNYIEREQKRRLDVDCRAYKEDSIDPTTPKTKVLLKDLRIRKLTPKECFRLMGVKDTDTNKIRVSNSQQYKQAGNSIVTTCLMAIFGQMLGIDYVSKINELVEEIINKGE